MKCYNLNGQAGLVEQRTNRVTKTRVSVYHGAQSGLEGDLETPWIVVCEEHSSCLSTATLNLARSHMSWPEWCEDCQPKLEAARPS